MATEKRKPTAEEARAILTQLSHLSHEQKADLAARAKPLVSKRESGRQQQDRAPQTDDELHAAIIRETGFDIPRVAVCDDHCAPFDPIADGFFHRYPGILIMKSREAGGTLNASILQYMLCKYVPTHEGVTYGAIEAQANKAFEYVKRFTEERVQGADGLVTRRIKPEIEGEPLRKRIAWKIGSLLSVIIATVAGTNSPHPNTAHADEYDLMDEDVIAQAANMAQPLDALVLTPSGWKTMGSIQVGDLVIGADGAEQKVLETHDVGVQQIYEIELMDGRVARCASGHRWLVGHRVLHGRIAWEVKTIDEILATEYVKPCDGGAHYLYRLPNVAPVRYADSGNLPLDPYVLGVLLGDGCIRRRLANFRADDLEIVELVGGRLPDGLSVYSSSDSMGGVYHRITRGAAGKNGTTNPVVAALEELRLEGCDSHTKFIPEIYMRADPDSRIMLLRGLMDTDGSFSDSARFASVSPYLAQGVCDIVRSLGGHARLRKHSTKSSSFKNCGYIYDVLVHLPNGINPFLTSRKACKYKPRTKTLEASIKEIRALSSELAKCITVESPDGLYVTDDFIVTHNCSSSVAPDGSRIPALDIITSTRKSMHGPMQRLIDEIEEANEKGYEASYKLYQYCVGEISEEVPMCRSVPDEQRRARLIELNLDPDLKCSCDVTIKGSWDENTPRTLESVCRGRFFRSRGWMPHDDVKRKFRKNTQTVWEAELECRRPMVDGLYLPAWNRSRYLTNNWTPRPELGPVFTGTDWGGTDLSYVIWSQFLLLPVTIRKRDGTEVEIPRFSYVVFDELYDAEAGATRLADMVVAQEVAWRRQVPGFFVKHRFADMAGKQQRNDWKQHNPPLRTIWPLPSRDFDPMVRCLQGLVEDQRYWVDERCSHHVDDIESWRQKNGRELHDASSHSMAASRYLHTSTELLHKRQQRTTTTTGDSIMPVIVQRQPSRDGGVAIAGQSNSFADEERWRGKLGGPIPMGWR